MENIKPLEEILLAEGLINTQQLNRAKEEAQKLGLSLEDVLIKLGFVGEDIIASKIAEVLSLPYVKLSNYNIDQNVIKLVPEEIARRYKLIPLFLLEDTLTLAMANPQNIVALDEIRLKTKLKYIDVVVAGKTEIENAINQYYAGIGDVKTILEDINIAELRHVSEDTSPQLLAQIAEETPVVKLVNFLIQEAVKSKASDIHIEPEMNMLRVRYRIDGILYEAYRLPKQVTGLITSRIKILGNLDIAEKRKPQDGRFRINLENREIDIRLSSFPTLYGENLVLRILDRSRVLLRLVDLGFGPNDLEKFNSLIHAPYGIILVTGPTGSGKTTTLYAALSEINSPQINIMTIEDPVEYQIPLLRQTQINPKAGLTFATGLRSILRQDPDVIMVGEIRDLETADIAIQAALTGHLVFSTLHTNDSAGALTRLIDMGIEPFLVSSSVIGIIAQRLIRLICPHCKVEYSPPEAVLKSLNLEPRKEEKFYRGEGCEKCKKTGYSGRKGIFEVLVINEEIRKLIVAKASASVIKQTAISQGMSTLMADGLEKARQGLTALEEVLRLTKLEE
ncbi:MAG: Flp pilus assembly complex ATPase component TadA [Candidatus Omnitrophica bacterium]|nr:Flp pilus assembly complex ATPase component TadA [Candidatus Omnitrophota bacterium]